MPAEENRQVNIGVDHFLEFSRHLKSANEASIRQYAAMVYALSVYKDVPLEDLEPLAVLFKEDSALGVYLSICMTHPVAHAKWLVNYRLRGKEEWNWFDKTDQLLAYCYPNSFLDDMSQYETFLKNLEKDRQKFPVKEDLPFYDQGIFKVFSVMVSHLHLIEALQCKKTAVAKMAISLLEERFSLKNTYRMIEVCMCLYEGQHKNKEVFQKIDKVKITHPDFVRILKTGAMKGIVHKSNFIHSLYDRVEGYLISHEPDYTSDYYSFWYDLKSFSVYPILPLLGVMAYMYYYCSTLEVDDCLSPAVIEPKNPCTHAFFGGRMFASDGCQNHLSQ